MRSAAILLAAVLVGVGQPASANFGDLITPKNPNIEQRKIDAQAKKKREAVKKRKVKRSVNGVRKPPLSTVKRFTN